MFSSFSVRHKITGTVYEIYNVRTEKIYFPVYNENEVIITYDSEEFLFFLLYGYKRENNWDWAIADFFEPVDEKYH